MLWFGAGFILEALYLVRRNPKWAQLAICAGVALVITVFVHLRDPTSDPLLDVGLGLGMAGIVLAALYQDEILPPVGDKLVLAFTLIFWFGFVTEFYHGTQLQQMLMFAALLPTAGTVYVAAARPALGFWGKLWLYTWYLGIVVFLGWLQFPFRNLSIFYEGADLGWLGPVDAFATGMASLYLLTNAWYLSELVPIPGKTQSFSDRMKEWHELTDLMTRRCSDEDGPGDGWAFAFIGVLGPLLLLNYVFALLPSSLVTSCAIVSAVMLLERLPTREARAAAPRVSRAPRE